MSLPTDNKSWFSTDCVFALITTKVADSRWNSTKIPECLWVRPRRTHLKIKLSSLHLQCEVVRHFNGRGGKKWRPPYLQYNHPPVLPRVSQGELGLERKFLLSCIMLRNITFCKTQLRKEAFRSICRPVYINPSACIPTCSFDACLLAFLFTSSRTLSLNDISQNFLSYSVPMKLLFVQCLLKIGEEQNPRIDLGDAFFLLLQTMSRCKHNFTHHTITLTLILKIMIERHANSQIYLEIARALSSSQILLVQLWSRLAPRVHRIVTISWVSNRQVKSVLGNEANEEEFK